MHINFVAILILFIILIILKIIASIKHCLIGGSKNPFLVYLLHLFITKKHTPTDNDKQNDYPANTETDNKIE